MHFRFSGYFIFQSSNNGQRIMDSPVVVPAKITEARFLTPGKRIAFNPLPRFFMIYLVTVDREQVQSL